MATEHYNRYVPVLISCVYKSAAAAQPVLGGVFSLSLYCALVFAGLLRLHSLYSAVASNGLFIDIESVRLTDVNNSFSTLRFVRSQTTQPKKYIIIDVSSEEALNTVLRQVRASRVAHINVT